MDKQKDSFLQLRYFIILIFLITSCGKSGGGSSSSASDTTKPSTSAGLSATAVSTTQIDLSWNASTDNVGVTGYKVYRGGSYLKSVSTTSTSDTGLSANTNYCYSICAYDAAGNESAQSSQVCTTTLVAWSGTKQWGTPSMDDSSGVAVDSGGNVFVCGFTNGNLDGNTNAGSYDAFLTQFISSGIKQWTKLLGSLSDDRAWGVAVDNQGNIYFTGDTSGNLDGQNSAGGTDIFLAKYDSSGTKQWTRVWGTASDDHGSSVAVDVNKNIYVTGNTSGNLDGQTNLSSSSIFITKFDSSGNKLWTKLEGPAIVFSPSQIVIDNNSNIYVAGKTYSDLDGYTLQGNGDIFLMKFDASGNKQWTSVWGKTSFSDYFYGMTMDSGGNIYVAGSSLGNFDGYANVGGEDIFITKFDSSGNKQWTKFWGTSTTDYPSGGVAVDSNGNIYVAGVTYGNLDGNTNTGNADIFLTKFDSAGNWQWTRLLGCNSYNHPDGIATDRNSNIFIAGHTMGNLDGNINAGQDDVFLVKYDSNGVKQ